AQAAWLDHLDREHDNFRAALVWCAEAVVSGQWSVVSADKGTGKSEPVFDLAGLTTDRVPARRVVPLTTAVAIGLRRAGAVARFWDTRGHWAEGRSRLEVVLAGAPARTVLRARALEGAGLLAARQGDFAGAVKLYQESLSICREVDDRPGIEACLNDLG